MRFYILTVLTNWLSETLMFAILLNILIIYLIAIRTRECNFMCLVEDSLLDSPKAVHILKTGICWRTLVYGEESSNLPLRWTDFIWFSIDQNGVDGVLFVGVDILSIHAVLFSLSCYFSLMPCTQWSVASLLTNGYKKRQEHNASSSSFDLIS